MRSLTARPGKFHPEPTEEEKAELRAWWLARYSMDELRVLGEGLSIDLPSERPWLALTG